MSRAAAIGEETHVAGYALAGVEVHPAPNDDAARAAWAALAPEVAFLILTPAARAALGAMLDERAGLVWAVIPE